jgi:hypothetical protein
MNQKSNEIDMPPVDNYLKQMRPSKEQPKKVVYLPKSSVAQVAFNDDNDWMANEITRNELAAEIKAIEASTDSKVAEIRGDIKTLSAEMRGDMQALVSDIRGELRGYVSEGKERDKRIELLVANAERNSQIASDAARDAAGLRSEARTAMITIVLSVFAIAAGSVIAIKSSNEAIVQTVTSVYQQGQANPPPPAASKK